MSLIYLEYGHEVEIINAVDRLIIKVTYSVIEDEGWEKYQATEEISYEVLSKDYRPDLIIDIINKLVQQVDEEYFNDDKSS